jgi:hypothetical protein
MKLANEIAAGLRKGKPVERVRRKARNKPNKPCMVLVYGNGDEVEIRTTETGIDGELFKAKKKPKA